MTLPFRFFALMLLSIGSAAAQSMAPNSASKPIHPALPPVSHPVSSKPAHKAPVVRPKVGTVTHRAPTPALVPAPPPALEPEKPAELTKGSSTGSPLPRFATLRSDEVNMRTGPGPRYPIDWVYKRRDLPVLIEREFDTWRLVRDPEGVKGWVTVATLAPRRTGVVIGGEQVLRADAKETAAAVARLKSGVIVRLRSCEATSDWCQAQVQDYRGWIRRSDVWGILPGEVIQ